MKTSTPLGRLKNLKRRQWLVVGLVLVVVVGLGYLFVARPIMVRRDKARFENAAKQLEQVYDKIVATAGKPDAVKREKACGYASRAWGNGPLSCWTSIYSDYGVAGSAEANGLLDQLNRITGSSAKDHINDLSKFQRISYSDGSVSPQSLEGDLRLSISRDIICIYEYTYPYPVDRKLFPNNDTSSESVLIGITCSGGAMAPHYKIE